MKYLNAKRLIFLLVFLTSLLFLVIFSFPDNRLHLVFCDVGQGDAILIIKGFTQILIDGGPNEKVLGCLANNLPFYDRKIEVVALTHPEADHLTGLISVLDKYRVDYFLTGPLGNDSSAFEALLIRLKKQQNASLVGKSPKIINIYSGDKIKIGEMVLTSLWPDKQWLADRADIKMMDGKGGREYVLGAKTEYKKLNDFSLVFLLKYQNKSFLFMGDADFSVQDNIIENSNLTQIDILKFPHHGSKTGIDEEFLKIIKPKETVISVGKNSYGHPSKEALVLLEKYRVKIRRTDKEGEIKYSF